MGRRCSPARPLWILLLLLLPLHPGPSASPWRLSQTGIPRLPWVQSLRIWWNFNLGDACWCPRGRGCAGGAVPTLGSPCPAPGHQLRNGGEGRRGRGGEGPRCPERGQSPSPGRSRGLAPLFLLLFRAAPGSGRFLLSVSAGGSRSCRARAAPAVPVGLPGHCRCHLSIFSLFPTLPCRR